MYGAHLYTAFDRSRLIEFISPNAERLSIKWGKLGFGVGIKGESHAPPPQRLNMPFSGEINCKITI
jgi:hypothetical protein